ncbi:MAG: DNA-processing protein DprA [Bacteroidales bacterium]|jgi:DNA processing protein|nr:DNA-processing protein DprA [Bacteroidales bacterium]
MVSIYELALAKVYGVGFHTAKAIMESLGSPEELFSQNKKSLELIFKSKTRTINDILNKTMFAQCERELEFMHKYGINSYFFLNDDYPYRLKQISDPPVCLFYCGNVDLNAEKTIAIVGSRNISDYGKRATNAIVGELRKYNATIVSGLAYGVDAAAHTSALNNGLATFGVLGHGLDMIYPRDNFDLAQQMRNNGGLVSEHFSGTKINPSLFPSRNRIIAGLSDMVIVIEAAYKSGALITARLANDYNREVMAVPGRMNDELSEGCNALIRKNMAHILSHTSDIARLTGWDDKLQSQQTLFDKPKPIPKLPKAEAKVYQIISENENINIDDLTIQSAMSSTQLASCLLTLEMDDLIETLPGKCYKIV